MFIGESLNTIGLTDQASEQFQKILKRMEADPEFAKRAKKGHESAAHRAIEGPPQTRKVRRSPQTGGPVNRGEPQRVGAADGEGTHSRSLAEKDPAKFDAAVGHWTMLRNRLQGMRKKPDEYYEVMYNVAKCLVREAEKSQDKAKIVDCAKKAEQVLKSPMILSPKLNGPDTVAKYKVLMNKAIVLQGRSPDAKGEKKP